MGTGVCVNVLSLYFVKDIGCWYLLEHYSGQAGTVDGSPLDIEGTIKARTQVGDVDTKVEFFNVQSIQDRVILGLMFMKTIKGTVGLHSKHFWTGMETSATPLQLKGKKQIDASTKVDCRSERAGVTPEAEICTGDKGFQQACFTRELVDEDCEMIVDLTAAEIKNEVEDKLMENNSFFCGHRCK